MTGKTVVPHGWVNWYGVAVYSLVGAVVAVVSVGMVGSTIADNRVLFELTRAWMIVPPMLFAGYFGDRWHRRRLKDQFPERLPAGTLVIPWAGAMFLAVSALYGLTSKELPAFPATSLLVGLLGAEVGRALNGFFGTNLPRQHR